eukprot:Sspe_Gene.3888::Locus_1294_Transcript_1_1_Confidence_1.000_Length_982::g.3888::m.3888
MPACDSTLNPMHRQYGETTAVSTWSSVWQQTSSLQTSSKPSYGDDWRGANWNRYGSATMGWSAGSSWEPRTPPPVSTSDDNRWSATRTPYSRSTEGASLSRYSATPPPAKRYSFSPRASTPERRYPSSPLDSTTDSPAESTPGPRTPGTGFARHHDASPSTPSYLANKYGSEQQGYSGERDKNEISAAWDTWWADLANRRAQKESTTKASSPLSESSWKTQSQWATLQETVDRMKNLTLDASNTTSTTAAQAASSQRNEWTEEFDPATGRIFYHNPSTGVSVWEKPAMATTISASAYLKKYQTQ